MEAFKLIGMTDFVLNYTPKDATPIGKIVEYKDGVINYAKFLKQPLNLGYFIPCNEYGIPLEEPKSSLIYKMQVGECSADEMRQNREYQQAKEKVLFDGYQLVFEFKKWQSTLIAKNKDGLGQFDIYDYETIEDLVFMDLTLTPNAIKQLGL